MFLDLAPKERDAFLSQTESSLIPGYTGHCPTLKFRFGKPYGSSTKDVIRELSIKDLNVRHEPYRQKDRMKGVLHPIAKKEGQSEDPLLPFKHRTRRYILGYTGYIPGMNFRYGKSFRRAADDSIMEFSKRMSQEEMRRERERGQRAQSAPKMASIRSRDDVKKSLQQYHDRKFTDTEITPECPPIAGYTGHIPRVRSTDVSLSQRYNTAARKGLSLLQQERMKRNELDEATMAVQKALQQECLCTTPAM